MPLQGVFEIDVEMQQPSIYQSPKVRLMLPDNYIAAVARVADEFNSGQYSFSNPNAVSPDGGWQSAVTKIRSMFKYLDHIDEKGIRYYADLPDPNHYKERCLQLFATVAALKTEAYIDYYTVFKRTLTAALPDQVQASYEGSKQIWTTAEVVQWENLAPDGWFQLPNSLWLKSPPCVVITARQKSQVIYSYTEAKQANGLIYDAYGDAKLLYATTDTKDMPPQMGYVVPPS